MNKVWVANFMLFLNYKIDKTKEPGLSYYFKILLLNTFIGS